MRITSPPASLRGRLGGSMEPVRLGSTMLPDVDIGSGSLRFAMDYVAFDYHSDTYSHIVALCHVAFEGCLYNGHPAAGITSRGAAVHGIEALKDGLSPTPPPAIWFSLPAKQERHQRTP